MLIYLMAYNKLMFFFKNNTITHLYIFFVFLTVNFIEFSTNKVFAKTFVVSKIEVVENYNLSFNKIKVIDRGFAKAFKGRWGGSSHTSRVGVIQDLNRLSRNSALSQLRKINLEIDASAKVVPPRLLHSSQYGIIDPIDTPDGGNIGTHKHLSIITHYEKI